MTDARIDRLTGDIAALDTRTQSSMRELEQRLVIQTSRMMAASGALTLAAIGTAAGLLATVA